MSDQDNFQGDPFASDTDNFKGDPFAPTTNTLGQEAKRQGGLLVRALASAAASPITMGGNVIGKALNVPIELAGGPKQYFKPSTEVAGELLTKAGLPKPERPLEQITQTIAESAPAFALPTTLPAQALGGAAIGAAQAPAGKEFHDAVLAGATAKATAMALRGFKPTDKAKALMEQGVQPSFGQSMGGTINKIEQQATSIPFVGDAVARARSRPVNEFEQKVLERVTAPGIKTVEEANLYASQLYDEVVPSLVPTKQSVQNVQQAMRSALQNPELTDDNRKILTGLANKHFQNFGQLDGQAIKNLDSELGYLARKYAGGDPAARTLADEIWNVQGAFRTGLEHGLPPDLQGKLQAANRTYAQMIPINKAASQRADEKLMPRAFQKAMARHERTDVTRMKPDALVDNAVAVLPSNVPDSGSAGRVLLGSAGAMGANAFGMLPAYATAGAGAYLGSARPVQRALVGNTKWQKNSAPLSTASAAALVSALRRSRENEP